MGTDERFFARLLADVGLRGYLCSVFHGIVFFKGKFFKVKMEIIGCRETTIYCFKGYGHRDFMPYE